VVMQDRDGRILASNASAERILGLSGAELSTGSTHRPANALIHEDGSELPVAEHPSILALRSGEPQRAVVLGIEGIGPDTRWISVNSSPLVLPGESEPYATVSSFTDITEMRQTVAELREARFEDLRRLALMAEYRDDDTNKHTERVAHASAQLAAALGMDGEMVQCLRRAAPLHDVGKVGIPDEILLKPGGLTAEQFEVIKTHTVIGGRILSESRFPVVRMAMEIAFTHHERWDGSGYPDGLAGQQIPLASRITLACDALHAMTSDRPYRPAVTLQYARQELQASAGSQFDPHVITALLVEIENRAALAAS